MEKLGNPERNGSTNERTSHVLGTDSRSSVVGITVDDVCITGDIDNDHREAENDTTHARAHPNDARVRSESEDEHGDRKGKCTKHHWIKTTLGDNTVLLTVLLVQPLLDRHTYVGNGDTDDDRHERDTGHTHIPASNLLKSDREGKEGRVEQGIDEGEVNSEEDDDNFLEHKYERPSQSDLDSFLEGWPMEVVLRDVNGSVVLLVESSSLLAEKNRGKSLRSEDAEDDTSTAKNEEDPVNPSPLTGFLGNPSIVRQH